MAVSEEKRRISISLPLDLLKDLTLFAFDHGTTKSEIAEEAIIDYMSKTRKAERNRDQDQDK